MYEPWFLESLQHLFRLVFVFSIYDPSLLLCAIVSRTSRTRYFEASIGRIKNSLQIQVQLSNCLKNNVQS